MLSNTPVNGKHEKTYRADIIISNGITNSFGGEILKITRLYIKNYKSIKEIDICLSELVNVFIGENSVGKSNIFAAIDWMLGPVFPSFNNFSKEDYYRGDTSLHVVIRVYFDDGHYLELTNYWNYRGY